MSTLTPPNPLHARRLRELREREKRAWGAYRDGLRDLSGREYEEAEHRSWVRLQRKLREVDEERAALTAPPPRRPEPS